MKGGLCAWILGLLISAEMVGQTNPGEVPEVMESSEVRFILLTEEALSLELYYSGALLNPETGPVMPQGPIAVGGRGFSAGGPYEGTSLYLWAKDPGAPLGYRGIARVNFVEPDRDYTVLLVPEGGAVKAYPIDVSGEQFKGGSTLFFNTLDVPIAARFNEDVNVVQPFQPLIVAPPKYEDKPWYGVRMYEPVEGGGARIFCSGRWPFQSSARVYNFIYRNSATGRIDYRSINEYR
ncbi:MAG: hypothetical protein ACQKBT_00965 [Puniceicoccales bacterium]